MKTTEIMINDLFYVKEGKSKRSVRITSIDSPVESVRGIYLDTNEDTGWFIVDLLIPIGLEEEILKANGFEWSGSRLIKRTDRAFFDIRVRVGSLYTIFGDCYEISYIYVYQLQHALRLCGLDDIANNFRIN